MNVQKDYNQASAADLLAALKTTSIYELLASAGQGFKPMDLPSDKEPPRADLTPQAMQLEILEADLYIQDIIANTTVSDAVRRECIEEMAQAKKRGWRL